jgi:hypothetical protein
MEPCFCPLVRKGTGSVKRVSVFYLFIYCFTDGKVTSRSIADGIGQKFTTTKRVVEAEPVIVSHAHAARWLASAAVSVLGHTLSVSFY